jgi:CHAT domain-containing protein
MSTVSKMAEVVENVILFQNAAYAAAQAGDPVGALLLLERGKTRLLIDALHLQISCPANVPDPVWTNFVRAGATVRASLTPGVFSLHEDENSVQVYKKRELRSQQASEALDRAVELVREYSPDFLREFGLSTHLARLLTKKTGLVAFCCTDQGSIGLVLSQRQEQQPVQVVDVPGFTRSALQRLLFGPDAHDTPTGGWIASYQHFLQERSSSAFADWQAVMEHTLSEVGRQLLTPVLAALSAEITQLIFLPSGELYLLPLHAAPLSSDLPGRMCDSYQVAYVPSLEVLFDSQSKRREEKDPGLYAIVNPTADLLFASVEGATIAQLFDKGRLDEGIEGTKKSVQEKVIGQTHIHFACHGQYNWENPSASGLDLTDGRLTVLDLQNGAIDLTSARIVTLSACESGMVDVARGKAEEYIGIPAGFLLAGVPCVVSSLWAVRELSTMLLMQRFYQNHLTREMNFARALQEAQCWLRDLPLGEAIQSTEHLYEQARPTEKAQLLRLLRHYRYQAKHHPALHPFEHPFYWAAFTCTGSWEVRSADTISQVPVS